MLQYIKMRLVFVFLYIFPIFILQNVRADEINPREDKKYQSLESFSKALYLLETNYVNVNIVNPEELIEKALKGMAADLDPHTLYLSPKQFEEFATDTSGKFGGIGVVINPTDGKIEVLDVIEKSPAEKVGIKAGDIIAGVNDIVVNEKSINNALNQMRGPVGSFLKLTVSTPIDPDDSDSKLTSREIKVAREIIHNSSVSLLELDNGYAYVKLSIFQEDSSSQMASLIKKFEEKNNGKISGLVLDLRGNPGGLLEQAVRVTNLFVDSGVIVSIVGRNKNKPDDVAYAMKRQSLSTFPMVILVNGETASASEIVAGALQDKERAIIMGRQTFGKGSVQDIVPLPNGGAIKMTIARYYTPKGRSIQDQGITPDIPLLAASVLSKHTHDKNEDGQTLKREVDLKGHIVANQQDIAALKIKDVSQSAHWPVNIRKDYEIQSAYLYLKNMEKYSLATRALSAAAAGKSSH